jgi:hypothetical protein
LQVGRGATMEVIKIFEEKFHLIIKNKIKSVLLENQECEGMYYFLLVFFLYIKKRD